MKWKEVKVVFDFEDRQLATDLISDIFYDFGLQGVVVESTETDPETDWADGAETIPENDAVIGYFPQNEMADEKCQKLKNELRGLENDHGITSQIVYNNLDEEDWAESWKEYFWPEKITPGIVVKPTWREYEASEDEIILEIDPGMAFGTGTHPTTALCIRMIERFLEPGMSFLDVGTGSGILMIAAAKLGAEGLVGVDTDEVAVEIAQKNLLENQIEKERFSVIAGNLVNVVNEQFDMVVANILSEVIARLLDDIRSVIKKDGIFIASGIIEKNKPGILQKMETTGFEILETRTEDQWVSIVGRLKSAGI
ncbi:MAG: ribosomal protein L11 methyltransferase [Desulfobacteraceae bacterium 4572_88]|nr:MAG: ribosomal protein L11 methyltransferase [Desulfobacteraceae bacterium 4572_88]RLC10229.1 MAG: 50S ribosomal protein L11 methyltransferase [Deltaproteobacteria bacterium]